jgi:hypothetical protein
MSEGASERERARERASERERERERESERESESESAGVVSTGGLVRVARGRRALLAVEPLALVRVAVRKDHLAVPRALAAHLPRGAQKGPGLVRRRRKGELMRPWPERWPRTQPPTYEAPESYVISPWPWRERPDASRPDKPGVSVTSSEVVSSPSADAIVAPVYVKFIRPTREARSQVSVAVKMRMRMPHSSVPDVRLSFESMCSFVGRRERPRRPDSTGASLAGGGAGAGSGAGWAGAVGAGSAANALAPLSAAAVPPAAFRSAASARSSSANAGLRLGLLRMSQDARKLTGFFRESAHSRSMASMPCSSVTMSSFCSRY